MQTRKITTITLSEETKNILETMKSAGRFTRMSRYIENLIQRDFASWSEQKKASEQQASQ